MASVGFDAKEQVQLDAISSDAVATSAIEGERLDLRLVRSSVARRLGLPGALPPKDAQVEGVVEMTLDATKNSEEPLTTKRLFHWHSLLFPIQLGRDRRVRNVASWRDDAVGPMQVISGASGREIIHFEAPPAARVPSEMEIFLRWFEAPPNGDGVMKAAISHLWFLTIHPFEDGNGRIARAIADLGLARDERSSTRFVSMTRQINAEKAAYYDAVESAQSGSLDVTPWLQWFLACYARSIDAALTTTADVLTSSRYWNRFAEVGLSDRQRKVLARVLNRFEGKLTVRKWAKLAQTSHDTANRDIGDLVEKGMLVRSPGGGRNTSYELAPLEPHSRQHR
jgi:Fic family protein